MALRDDFARTSSPDFLSGGGAVGALMRAMDWSKSSLGVPSTWPAALKTLVGVMLGSNQPMFVVWGLERTLLYNDAYIQIIASKHPKALACDFLDVWHEIPDFLVPVVAEAYAGRPVHMDEIGLTVERKGYPEEAHFAFSFTPVRDEAGAVSGFFCAATETTEQVLGERRRAADAARQRRLFEQAPGFIAILSGPELRFEFVNETYGRLFGRRDFLGKTVREVFPDLAGQGFHELLDDVCATGEPFVASAMAIRLQETAEAEAIQCYLDFIYEPVRGEDGAVTGVFIEGHDVTARMRAERALGESEARLRGVLYGMGEGFALLAPDFTILELNDEAMRLETRPPEAIVGRTHWEAYPGSEEAEIGRLYKRAMAERVPVALEHRYEWAEGHTAWLDMRAYPTADGGLAIFYRDVTERVQTEAVLRESEARNRFRVGLGDALRGLASPSEIMAAVAERLGRHFGADEADCHLTDGDRFVVTADWEKPIDGRDIRPPPRGGLPRGDAQAATNNNVAASGAAETASVLSVPLAGDGRWTGGFRVHSDSPRAWTDDEAALVQETAERAWAAVKEVQAEAELRELNATLERRVDEVLAGRKLWADVVASSDAMIAALSPSYEFLAVNEAYVDQFERVYGTRPQVGNRLDMLLAHEPEHRAQVLALWDKALAGQAVAVTEAFGDPSLDCSYWDMRFNPLRDKIGERIGAFQYAVDVSGRLHAQAELAERTAELERTWRLSQDLLGIMQPDGCLTAVNEAWTQALGWTERELVGRTILELAHPDDVEPTLARLRSVFEKPLAEPYEYRLRHKDGSYRWVSWTAAFHGGRIFANGRDITERRTRQAALDAARESLHQSQKLESMGQLTGGVAHDLNNLLTPIMGSLDLLRRRGIGTEREQRMIDGALQSAERAKVLVQRLLAFARRQPLQAVAVDLAALVTGMTDLIGSTLAPRVRLELDLGSNLPPARADANQLELAILNLAVNARDAMAEGGTLTIAVKSEAIGAGHRASLAPATYVRLTVTDTGTGMDEATLARAAEPFFSTKGVGKGTGLGLSMVHGLAAQLGGALCVASKPDFGTTIDLWLPVSAGEAAPANPLPERAREPTGPAGTALLVDDEELVRLSTAEMLVDLGYRVVEAGSAEEALDVIERGLVFDLLVTDHLMAGLTGTDLAQQVRARMPAMPVLIVSGYAESEGIAVDLPRLAKPYQRDDLAASLAACTGKARPESREVRISST